jgi:predicted phage terminase large subunit-like protein
MQRIHEQDFAAMLINDIEFDWHSVVMEGLLNEGQENEAALWEAKHSVEQLKAIKAKNSYNFSAQYQQNPKPLGGGIIKGAWFRRYDIPPKISYKLIFADTAQKTKERNDYSVFELWGMGEDKRIYLLDLIRGKWAPELKQTAIDFWNKHKSNNNGTLRAMKVEDKASGTGLIQDIKREGKIPIYGIQRTTDKLTRVMDIVSYVESGYVMIPNEAAWVSEFIHECEAFTKDDTHAHDDQIDPMCDAINDMLQKTNKGFFS